MRVHFIAIGGSAMHNLAIALSRKGYQITGSDDEIFEPSKGRLKKEGILPDKIGWDVDNIDSNLNAVILGMHAREDNPELLKAKELGLKIFSYPEYLYEQCKDKIRLVIGGSHGKTTITSMLLHVFKELNVDVDYMVGAQLDGYDCMVKMTEKAKIMVLEGDEYLSSPIDRRPKFHLYKPDHAIISGIAWDHINVFPTFENYVDQFDLFCQTIDKNGSLIYASNDKEVDILGKKYASVLDTIPYGVPAYTTHEKGTKIIWNAKEYTLKIFGAHNLQNLLGAMHLAEKAGVENEEFLKAAENFTGAGKRLQKVGEEGDFVMYKDFAHSPSKLKATTSAVKEQYIKRKVVACMELHTFSSLNKVFLPHYLDTMTKADEAIVYYNHEVVAHKKLPALAVSEVEEAFGEGVRIFTDSQEMKKYLTGVSWQNSVLLMMSSGNFDGIDFDKFYDDLKSKL
ncbi:MAG: UDP-N-acetylmuramate: L-alanyl-gamma-D-glutamyl-meso-diaminopimelate ligase [Lentimonas sp.]|jgi:UDP-N-acetylmuramate: L-alanyl-gamma-D-glutamyl-meso-diaminopimelate ligase